MSHPKESIILGRLLQRQDPTYRDFHKKLLPTVDPERLIGVRTPQLRSLAKELSGTPEAEDFLASLPHTYYDENTLHGLLISNGKDVSCPSSIIGPPAISRVQRSFKNTCRSCFPK